MKILSVIGARPNFVKMSPLIREIRKNNLGHVLVHTDQHYDEEMSKIFLEELSLSSIDYHLNVGSGTHGYQTGKMLIELEKVMLKENPDIVLVPGDTNTTLAGALAAVKLHISIGHVEAGLRSFDREMPEEINRVLTDHSSDLLFAPTETAVKNLEREGILEDRVFLTGDTMLEACYQNLEIAKKKSKIFEEYSLPEDFILVTIHRAENTDDINNLRNITHALMKLEHNVVFPIHPRTEKRLKKFKLWNRLRDAQNIYIMKPVGYIDFLMLLSKTKLILTDSGGVQKEAFFLKKPCVTLRDNTEWIETIELGWNILVGIEVSNILGGVKMMLNKDLTEVKNPFGDGHASERIVDILTKYGD